MPYVPTPHPLQPLALAAAKLPAAQDEQADAAPRLYVPAPQVWQTLAFTAARAVPYEPAAHVWHMALDAAVPHVVEKVPAGHATQPLRFAKR